MNKAKCLGKFYVINGRISNVFYEKSVQQIFKTTIDEMYIINVRHMPDDNRNIEYTVISPKYCRELHDGEPIPIYGFEVVNNGLTYHIVMREVISE